MARPKHRAKRSFVACPNGAGLNHDVSLFGEDGYITTTAAQTAAGIGGAGEGKIRREIKPSARRNENIPALPHITRRTTCTLIAGIHVPRTDRDTPIRSQDSNIAHLVCGIGTTASQTCF